MTSRVGALDGSYLQRGRPLGEARVLDEPGESGLDVRTLRKRLKLDSGYVSRLLRSLETRARIKRMWTARAACGLGIARRLEAEARRRGLTRVRLETNRTLVEAQTLYRRDGFREVPPFNADRYARHSFEKSLWDAASRAGDVELPSMS